MPTFDEIPEPLRLNYFVGDIVISDSFTEHEARVLWGELLAVGLVPGKRPEMFGRLLPNLEDAFKRPEVPDDLRQMALDLLATTRTWHTYRRDLVHDLLTMGWGRGDEVVSALRKHPPRPMRDLAECARAIRTSGYRLRGLYIIAPYWLGGKVEGWETAEDLRSWTRVAMGHIADVPSVITGTEGHAPEPPGGWDHVVATAIAAREAREARRAFLVFDAKDDE